VHLKGVPMRVALISLVLSVCVSCAFAQTPTGKPLNVYVVDVEGGNAVLFVTPSGESVLIDSGNVPPGASRDADRILGAVRDAGSKQIDHLTPTHYHGDHVGGLPELASRIPIREFIDHGSNIQPAANVDPILQQYANLYGKAKHTIAKPGDKI